MLCCPRGFAAAYVQSTDPEYIRLGHIPGRPIKTFFIQAQNFDKVEDSLEVPFETFRGFEYHMREICVTACICAMALGYVWQRWVLGLHDDHPVHVFWFPKGQLSFSFVLITLANDVIQDLISHAVVARAERRHPTPNHFSKIFPGAVSDKRKLLRFIAAAGVALWVPGWVSAYAFLFRTRGVI